MSNIASQARTLDETIRQESHIIYDFLSSRGKEIFFPKKGILAQAAEAKGKKLNATIGIALDNNLSPVNLPSIAKNIKLKPQEVFPYAPSYGLPELRRVWQKMLIQKNPSLKTNKISLPVVTAGITHALSIIGYLFIDEGDRLTIPDLFWGNYKLIFQNTYGAKFDTYPLFGQDCESTLLRGTENLGDYSPTKNKIHPNFPLVSNSNNLHSNNKRLANVPEKGYRAVLPTANGFNLTGLKQRLLSPGKKKIVLLNFPNNPTGYTPFETEAEQITSTLKQAAKKGKQILVICDDAYFGLVYEKKAIKESIFARLANLDQNILAVKLDGATKEDYVWGFRIGFITYGTKNGTNKLYESLTDKTAGAVRGTISNAPRLSQSLLLAAYNSPTYQKEKNTRYKLLKSRYLKVKQILAVHPEYRKYFTPYPFNSGYFMCVKILQSKTAESVRQQLLKKFDTGVIAFENNLRIAFSSVPEKDLPELFANIYKACQLVKNN